MPPWRACTSAPTWDKKRDELATPEAMRQAAEVNAALMPGPTPEQMANAVFAGHRAPKNHRGVAGSVWITTSYTAGKDAIR